MNDTQQNANTRPAISLVLGGGGGKGIAHIGVFHAISEHRLEIRSIVGTSIGALWGALFLHGLEEFAGEVDKQDQAVKLLEKFVLQLRFKRYRDLAFGRFFTKGFVQGKKLATWLETILWKKEEGRTLEFHDSTFDLCVTATNALSGESVVFNRTETPSISIAHAARASSSIQGFFEDMYIDIPGKGKTRFWDGGTTGNCRFDLALRSNPSLPVIASSLTYRGDEVDVDKNIFKALFRISRVREHSFNILLRQIESVLLENLADKNRVLLLQVPLSGITTFDLDIDIERKKDAIKAAQAAAYEKIAEFRKKLNF